MRRRLAADLGTALSCLAALAWASCTLPFDRSRIPADAAVDAPCTGGGRACCTTGCWDGRACVAGDVPAGCGAGGVDCAVCRTPTDHCLAGNCVVASPVVALSTSATHVCVVIDGGRGVCWGSDRFGAVGDGSSGVDVGPTNVSGPTDWRSITAMGGYQNHTCGITIAGATRCWGNGVDYELGTGDGSVQLTPVTLATTYRMLAGGDAYTCGIRDDGRLACWGFGAALGESPPPASFAMTPTDVTTSGAASDWTYVAGDIGAACGIRGMSGALYCWGDNDHGRLAIGDASTLHVDAPTPVGTSFTSIAVGTTHVCGVHGGSVQCAGSGTSGELGNGGSVDSPSMVDVVSLSGTPTAVCVGNAHSCALVAGAIYCWGANDFGQLGSGDHTPAQAPHAVTGGATDWQLLACGGDHTCATKRDGTVWCWGDDSDNQIDGMGSTPTPTRIDPPP